MVQTKVTLWRRTTRVAQLHGSIKYLVIIGTSLNVYPAAGLVHYAKKGCRIFLIDPAPMNLNIPNFQQIQAPATEGMKQLQEILGV